MALDKPIPIYYSPSPLFHCPNLIPHTNPKVTGSWGMCAVRFPKITTHMKTFLPRWFKFARKEQGDEDKWEWVMVRYSQVTIDDTDRCRTCSHWWAWDNITGPRAPYCQYESTGLLCKYTPFTRYRGKRMQQRIFDRTELLPCVVTVSGKIMKKYYCAYMKSTMVRMADSGASRFNFMIF